VRVPRAWGEDGESMVEAAFLELPYPEAGVVEEDTLTEQTLAIACSLPERPLVVGGCCCAHVGAVEALATRVGRLGIVWFDAHGDLNTPESSPSGNPWGMPLRMLIDSDTVAAEDVVLVGARNLDPPEEKFIAESGLRLGEERVGDALEGVDAVYVAFDCDVLEPDCGVAMFMPEPGGMTPAEAENVLAGVARHKSVAGLGFSGLVADPANVPGLARFCRAVGL
jgi:arginase